MIAMNFKGVHLLLILIPEQNEFHFHLELIIRVYLITRFRVRKLLIIS